MTSDQFAYWLHGFTELHGEPPTAAQWATIKDHLALVFNKVTPNRNARPVRIDDLPLQPDDASPWDRPDWPKWSFPPSVTCSAGGVVRADLDSIPYC